MDTSAIFLSGFSISLCLKKIKNPCRALKHKISGCENLFCLFPERVENAGFKRCHSFSIIPKFLQTLL